jgi:hypothetical protein
VEEKTLEQQARDLLETLGMDGAQELSAGDVLELANLIGKAKRVDRYREVSALALERVLAAYDELDHGAKLHLGYAYRHRGATGAVIFVQQHGHKREVRAFIALLEEVGLPVPEGF